jgi:[amino group carrier protein]-lysine/ornithine hydrolase
MTQSSNHPIDEVALLEGLLQHYSPTGQETQVVNYLVEQMWMAGLQAHVDEAGNAVGLAAQSETALTGKGPMVMLLGHIDTVPGLIPVKREGDSLHGRGAVDAKGPLACFVSAVVRLAQTDCPLKLVVVGAVGEEGDSRGAHFIKTKYRPDFTIIGEPSGWEKITLGYKGSAWFEYQAARALAHTSAQNESACEAAVSFWNRVTTWAAERNRETTKMFEQVNPTLRGMHSDSDGFVETAELKFGVRLPPGLSVSELELALRDLATEAELRLMDGVPAYRSEKNTPLVRAFLAGIRAAGGTPGFTLKSGTSDMNIVAPLWDVPIVAYGPGDSVLDHTPEEHLLVSEYRRAIEVLTNALWHLSQ